MTDLVDRVTKLLSSPQARQAVMDEYHRQLAERQAQREAEAAELQRIALDKALAAVVAKFKHDLDEIAKDVAAIKKSDGERRYLAALNYAQHNNGRLTFDRARFEAPWSAQGTA
jgi:ribosomal protein L2